MSERDDGGQAFPKLEREWDQDDRRYHYSMAEGATLRDFFAAHALKAIVTHADGFLPGAPTVASLAYAYADAMLAERTK